MAGLQYLHAVADNVNHPEHYTKHPSGIECIQVTRHMGFNLGNATKYVFRHDMKGRPIEDLQKAQWYLNDEIGRLTTERWKPYPLDDRYEVSSLGQVRRRDTGRLRKLVPIKNGYLTVGMVVRGKNVLRYVHRMVAETFLGGIPEKQTVCHDNGCKSDNRVTNLRIDTVEGNLRDRRRHGTHFVGEQNPAAKLTPQDVTEIRCSNENVSVLAERYEVSQSTVKRVLSGKSWGDHRTEHQILTDKVIDASTGNIKEFFTLLWRADLKGNQIEDLRKAVWYINDEIEKLSKPSRQPYDDMDDDLP